MNEIRQHVKTINDAVRAAIGRPSVATATASGPLVKAKKRVGYYLNLAPDEIRST